MSNIDQFESVFRSAIRDVYEYDSIEFNSILIITDLDELADKEFSDRVKSFYGVSHTADSASWHGLSKHDFSTTSDLLQHIERIQPDLIFTYRNLHSMAWKFPHSLGEHLDVLIQKTDIPVFILPHPQAGYAMDHTLQDCDVVMALTDHLSNDHRLVNYALNFTQKHGILYLDHIEDADTFNRYINAISRIQSIDTDDAIKSLSKELLKQPEKYINTVIERLQQEKLSVEIKSEVSFGHHLTEFRKSINEYKIDLLVMNSRDKKQMAMHGLAYPLAIELRQIPLLMI